MGVKTDQQHLYFSLLFEVRYSLAKRGRPYIEFIEIIEFIDIIEFEKFLGVDFFLNSWYERK